jgi:hypothetical protein
LSRIGTVAVPPALTVSGDTTIDCTTSGSTVNVAVFVTPAIVAEMVAVRGWLGGRVLTLNVTLVPDAVTVDCTLTDVSLLESWTNAPVTGAVNVRVPVVVRPDVIRVTGSVSALSAGGSTFTVVATLTPAMLAVRVTVRRAVTGTVVAVNWATRPPETFTVAGTATVVGSLLDSATGMLDDPPMGLLISTLPVTPVPPVTAAEATVIDVGCGGFTTSEMVRALVVLFAAESPMVTGTVRAVETGRVVIGNVTGFARIEMDGDEATAVWSASGMVTTI